MRKNYDFSKKEARRNPYFSKLSRPVTLRLGEDVISYFQGVAEETSEPYELLMSVVLRDYVISKRKVEISE